LVLYLSGVVRPDMPAMLQPGMGNAPPPVSRGRPTTGASQSPHYSDAGYLRWLAKRSVDVESCLFATAPDVVGDAAATLALSAPLFRPIRQLGYPVALVAQDGLEHLDVPWADFDALFIGGTTAWKLSEAVVELVAEAKRQGKWVHMGRVNSYRRLRFADTIGCDSADGTFLKYGPDQNAIRIAEWFERLNRQPSLWSA
jgi:hypothetical protein